MAKIFEANRLKELTDPLRRYDQLWEKLRDVKVTHWSLGEGTITDVQIDNSKSGPDSVTVYIKFDNYVEVKRFISISFHDGKFIAIRMEDNRFEKLLQEWESRLSDPNFRNNLTDTDHVKVLLDFLRSGQATQSITLLEDELFKVLSGNRKVDLWSDIPNQIIQKEKFDSIAPLENRIHWRWSELQKQDDEHGTQLIDQIINILRDKSPAQRELMLPEDPVIWRKFPVLLQSLQDDEQVEIVWSWTEDEIKHVWTNFSLRGKILFIFRAAVEKKRLDFLTGSDKNKLVLSALMLLNDTETQNRRFERAHNLFQDYVISQAWNSVEVIDLKGYLPLCRMGIVTYCEVKPWPDEKDKNRSDGRVSRTYCPRMKRSCEFIRLQDVNQEHISEPTRNKSPYGARLYPEVGLNWRKWSLLELIQAAGLEPMIRSEITKEYVQKLSGWINRLNEIRERLKCSVCGELMRPNMKYTNNMASYAITIVSCRHGLGHDQNIYLNHCWACRELIDSRESSIILDGFYICIHCGSGPKKSNTYTQGDICPKCGKENSMMRETTNLRNMICRGCGHEIRLPADIHLTG